MKLRKLVLLSLAGAFVSLLAAELAYASAHTNKMSREEGQVRHHAALSFESGSAMLTQAQRDQLRSAVNSAREMGVIEQVTIASWSDKRLPALGAKHSESDRDLAERRANAISSFLNVEFELADVEVFNMAEGTNWLARVFQTKEAELKSVFTRKGAEAAPITDAEFKYIKREGGPNMAVVVFERMSK